MLLSLLYRLVWCLPGLLAVLVPPDLSKDAGLLVLRQENQVLRRQLSGRPRWDHAGRLWLTALSRLVNRRRWPEIFPVTPATIVRWHRHLVAPGRPQVDLYRPAPARATVHGRFGQDADRWDGATEPGLGP